MSDYYSGIRAVAREVSKVPPRYEFDLNTECRALYWDESSWIADFRHQPTLTPESLKRDSTGSYRERCTECPQGTEVIHRWNGRKHQ